VRLFQDITIHDEHAASEFSAYRLVSEYMSVPGKDKDTDVTVVQYTFKPSGNRKIQHILLTSPSGTKEVSFSTSARVPLQPRLQVREHMHGIQIRQRS
jgi:hypothetical protein